MRWDEQRADRDDGALFGASGLIRSVQTPEFSGITFHEVHARSVLNRVPAASNMPFRWTVNPYRGCSHACRYCFARNSHTYLDLDAGRDFDTQVVVKTNAGQVLRKQLAAPSWQREHVAMGTNTDPYQRAEGRYALMPGIITALADSGTPFSILTKGTVAHRDLDLLSSAARRVGVGVAVSLALLDRELQHRLEPGTPSPQARLELIRKLSGAGLPCDVLVAPVLPWLTDSTEQLDALLEAIAAAGARGVTVLPLHLRPGAREWFTAWLAAEHAELVPRYRRLYSRGSNVTREYRETLGERVRPLLRRHGLDRGGHRTPGKAAPTPAPEEAQLSLL
jgi:DNA repair photolyase